MAIKTSNVRKTTHALPGSGPGGFTPSPHISMNKNGFMVADGDGVQAESPVYGDTWQGDELNRLVPALERAGWSVIAGTLDHEGLSVRGPSGCRTRIDLVAPGTLRVYSEDHDDDEAPSDQYPALASLRLGPENGWDDLIGATVEADD